MREPRQRRPRRHSTGSSDNAVLDLPADDAREQKRRRRRIIAAILAGGTVAGLGTEATLASWTETDSAIGTFTASTMAIEGSVDGTHFTNHPTGGPATLSFTVNPTSLTPGDTVYAPYAIRLAANSNAAAKLILSGNTVSGTTTNLTYTLIQPSSYGCTSATTGTALATAGTAVGLVAGAVQVPLAVGSPTTNAGAAIDLCLAVTAGGSLAQGQTGTATWTFTATSS